MRLDDVGRAAGARRRAEFDAAEAPARRVRARRHPALTAAAVALTVVLVSIGIVAVTRGDDAPTADDSAPARLVAFARTFGPGTAMTDVEGFPGGFVASGQTGHRCIRNAPVWACLTSRVWYSQTGTHWSEIEFPAFRTAHSAIALGRAGNQVFAIWKSASGLAVARSTDGERWRRSVVRSPDATGSASETDAGRLGVSFFDFGRRSGGLVVTSLDAPDRSWTSRDGAVWAPVPLDTDHTNPTFTFPQGVRVGDQWIALAMPGGSWGNGSTYEPPQVMVSPTGRGWSPVPSNVPGQMHRPLTTDARHRYAVAAQFHILDVPQNGCGLYQTSDGTRWFALVEFTRRPDMRRGCSPYEVARSRSEWVVSGTVPHGDRQRAALWISPDLRHWTTRLAPPGATQPEMVAVSGATIVAVPRSGRWIRVVRFDR